MSNTYRKSEKFVPTEKFERHIRKVDNRHEMMLVDDGQLGRGIIHEKFDESGKSKRDRWEENDACTPKTKKFYKKINHRNLRINGKNSCRDFDDREDC